VFYRVGQFFRAAFARIEPHERACIRQYLTPAQAALFGQMARADQRHALDVLHTLRRAGCDDLVLLQAALLHDVGKAAVQLTLWHRVGMVLMGRFAPRWLDRLAQGQRRWTSAFAVQVRHPEIGAQRAAEAGCSAEVVDLIRRHQDPDPGDKRLAALQSADRQN
jgi:putative nucleotidyltransferase with HDIG domain